MHRTDCIALKYKGDSIAVVTNGLTEFRYIIGVAQYCNLLKKRFGDGNVDICCLCKVTDLFLKTIKEDYFCNLDCYHSDTYKYVAVIDDISIALFENSDVVGACYLCASEFILCAIDDAQDSRYRLGHDYIKKEVAKQTAKSDLPF